MNHTQIACFLAAAQSEIFSIVADSMYMTPHAFGRKISSLEQERCFPRFPERQMVLAWDPKNGNPLIPNLVARVEPL